MSCWSSTTRMRMGFKLGIGSDLLLHRDFDGNDGTVAGGAFNYELRSERLSALAAELAGSSFAWEELPAQMASADELPGAVQRAARRACASARRVPMARSRRFP